MGVKLWRPYGYSTPLLCARCAALETKTDISDMTDEGLYHTKTTPQATDQIGGFIPAVPHDKYVEGFWGYTSIPEKAVRWWKTLKTISTIK